MAAATKDLKAKFEAATVAAKKTKKKPDNSTLLKLYSYYKQATEGDAKGDRPGGFDFVGASFLLVSRKQLSVTSQLFITQTSPAGLIAKSVNLCSPPPT